MESDGQREEEAASRSECVGPRAWVVAVATLPFLALGVSLSCIGYLAKRDGKGADASGLGQHFRIAGPVLLSACTLSLLLCCVCRRPGVGRVGTDAVGPRYDGDHQCAKDWWTEGCAEDDIGRASDEVAWGSCSMGCPSKAPVRYPVGIMVPPLLKIIPPTPESPAGGKDGVGMKRSSPHHLILLTPLKVRQRT